MWTWKLGGEELVCISSKRQWSAHNWRLLFKKKGEGIYKKGIFEIISVIKTFFKKNFNGVLLELSFVRKI